MSQVAWQSAVAPVATATGWYAVSGEDRDTDTDPGRSAPPAHSAWGPESWPDEIRENIKVWPPLFRERQLLAAVRAPLTSPQRIAFVSNKDGVGKTTTAQILQTIFANSRGEPCALLDANTENRKLRPEGADKGLSPGAARPIVPPPHDPEGYSDLLDLLSRAYPIVICDVGTLVGDSATRQILDSADHIVVVATPAVDGLYAASSCLDDLRSAGYGDLVDNAICAITRIRPMPFSDLLNIDRHFQRRCREVVRIPWDSRVSRDNSAELDELRPTTRTGFFELAAAVARGFGDSTTNNSLEGKENL